MFQLLVMPRIVSGEHKLIISRRSNIVILSLALYCTVQRNVPILDTLLINSTENSEKLQLFRDEAAITVGA